MKDYLYLFNCQENEKGLCKMELKSLFYETTNKKYILSNTYVNPSRSPYIKEMMSLKYSHENLDELIKILKEESLEYNDFKVIYIKTEDRKSEYKERLRGVKEIGYNIKGIPNFNNPKVLLGLSEVNGKWFFGRYEKNDFKWHNHEDKPFNYSNALTVRMSRALVNIAVGNDLSTKVIDPCCGIGTVIIEALDMGINIKGVEINPSIASNAKENLKHFNFENVIETNNISNIKEKFQVGIVDMPYGLFTAITYEEQLEIIKAVSRIVDKLIIITFQDMKKEIKEVGFEFLEEECVKKNNVTRYISKWKKE